MKLAMRTLFSRPVVFGLIAIVTASISACRTGKEVSTSDDKSLADETISVHVKSVELRPIGPSTTALGRCEALPQKQALLTPVIEGKVAQILATSGDRVKGGQAIVQMDTTLARADLAEKEAARDSLVASLSALQSRARPEEQISARLAVEQADVAVRRAEALLDRLRPLRQRNEVPEVQIYEAEEGRKQAQLQKQTAQAQLDVLLLSPRKELIDEAKSKIKVAEEAVKTAETRVALHTVKAPITGVLENLSCRIGQMVTIGNSIGEITDSQEIIVVAWLPSKWREAIHVGNVARVNARMPTSSAKTKEVSLVSVKGQVIDIGKSADLQTGNIPARVLVDNRDGKLLIGQTVSINILLDALTETICVPLSAVHDEEDGPTLRVVRNEKAVILHPTIGARDENWAAVSNTDLKPGERVVVSDGYNLPDGTPVKPQSENEVNETEIGSNSGYSAR